MGHNPLDQHRHFLIWVVVFSLLTLLAGPVAGRAETNQDAVRDYLDVTGGIFFHKADIRFRDIGSTAKHNAQEIWPFDRREAEEKYLKAVKRILGGTFRPVQEYTENPFEVEFTVNLLNDADAVTALIHVRIVRNHPFMETDNRGEVSFFENIPVVLWEQSYMYIDPEYFVGGDGAKFHLEEIIDKYFNEFLYGFVNKILYYQKIADTRETGKPAPAKMSDRL
jgi:hypothetical protein